MKKYCKITPEGTRDLLFEECLTYRNIEKLLAGVFQSRGFHEVITPGLEYYDVFSQGESSIPQEFMFKVTDNKGRLMVVRPDSTLPIARLTATSSLCGCSIPKRFTIIIPAFGAGITRSIRAESNCWEPAGCGLI